MGIFRMFTGADGKSVIEELSQDDPILETLKTCTGCALQINAPPTLKAIAANRNLSSKARLAEDFVSSQT